MYYSNLTCIHTFSLSLSLSLSIYIYIYIYIYIDLVCYDYEVAGVQFNGGKDIIITRMQIGPSRKPPVLGMWSTGIFILPYIKVIQLHNYRGLSLILVLSISNLVPRHAYPHIYNLVSRY